MRWLVLVVALGCSSPHPASTPPDGSPDGKTMHADGGGDAPADAPILGNACPTHVSEVARITGALSNYPYLLVQLLVADVDHDGHDDIVAIEGQSDETDQEFLLRIRVFLRTSTGFAAPVQSDLVFPFYGPELIQLGDFNGDHLPDILISYTDSGESSRTSYVYVATQQAGHTFVLGPEIDVSACSFSDDERLFALAVVDANQDGYDDVLATVSYGGLGAPPAGVSILAGSASGLGLATCASSYPADMGTAQRFATGDFDGNGERDVAGVYEDHASSFLATGASQFTEGSASASFDGFAFVATDHLANRTDRGLIALSTTATGSTANRYAIGTNGVATGQSIASLNENDAGDGVVRGFAVGDFNGDGLTDVIEVGNHDYNDNYPDPISFGMACDRGGEWQMSTGMLPDGIYNLRAIDYAGSGTSDVVVREGSDYDLVIYQLN
ncbi:MAG TPA: VCBS repeat-containing protein [Kofleriaceae bacterium]|nr:VCBS repeat-containing protein [Kofleriaceae bacterium]